MVGGDSGCGIGLLGVTSKKCYIPQTEQHSPFRVILLRLGNVTIIWFCNLLYIFPSSSLPLSPQDGTSSELPGGSGSPCTSPLPLWSPGINGGVPPEPDGPLHPWHSQQGDRERPPFCTVCLFPQHLLLSS